MGTCRIFYDNKSNRICVQFGGLARATFNAVLGAIKHTPNSRWDASRKLWRFPATPVSLTNVIDATTPFANFFSIPNNMLEAYKSQRELDEWVASLGPDSLPDSEHLVGCTPPYQFQDVGIEFIHKVKACLLLDEMGLGKTLTALYAALESDEIHKVLVICPNSLKYTWANETELHTDAGYSIIKGDKETRAGLIDDFFAGDDPFCIVNYESFRVDTEEYVERDWDMVVLDECQKIKNYKTLTFKAVMKLKDVPYKVGMSGTPLTGKLGDIFNISKFISPDRFGGAFFKFRNKYMIVDRWGNPIEYLNIDDFKSILNRYSLRRLKKDVVDLPDKIFIDEWLEMEPYQNQAYHKLYTTLELELKEKKITAANILTAILRLTQLTTGPHVLDPSESLDDSIKVRELDRLLMEQTEEHKVVVWTRFVTNNMQPLLERYAEYNPLGFHGELSTERREENKVLFQEDPKYRVMIANPQAGGLGITWTAADICIFIDKPMQMELIPQAIDRLHRIGTYNPVTVVSLITKNTVDERVERIIKTKLNLARGILDEEEFKDSFTLKELLWVFSGSDGREIL